MLTIFMSPSGLCFSADSGVLAHLSPVGLRKHGASRAEE